MTLRADIKYKSNWQQGTLKAQRRNKWICALKSSLEKLKIFGPDGNPNAQTAPTKYTQVPYEEVLRQEEAAKRAQHPSNSSSMSELHIPKSDWTFADQNSAIVDDSQDVFGEQDQVSHSVGHGYERLVAHRACSYPQLFMTNPRSMTAPRLVQRPPPIPTMPMAVTMPAPSAVLPPHMEEIELTPRPGAPHV